MAFPRAKHPTSKKTVRRRVLFMSLIATYRRRPENDDRTQYSRISNGCSQTGSVGPSTLDLLPATTE